MSAFDLESSRARIGAAPRKIGFFGWKDKLQPVPRWTKEVADEPLLETLSRQKEIWRQGRLVWGYIVVAERALKRPGETDLPAEVVYSLTAEDGEALAELPLVAEKLRNIKMSGAAVEQLPESERQITAHLRVGPSRAFGMRVPASMSCGLDCHISTCLVHRSHLPEGRLGGRLAPLLVLVHQVHDVLLLPQKWWPSELVVSWNLAVAKSQERRSLSQKRMAATAHEREVARKTPSAVPWTDATSEAILGTWVWEGEEPMLEEEAQTLSQWSRIVWTFAAEQRCHLNVTHQMLVDGEETDDLPSDELSFAGTFEIAGGLLVASFEGDQEVTHSLTIASANEIIFDGCRYART